MSGKIERFEDLDCWKEARVLVKMVYQVTNLTPLSKDFGLRDQLQRAAVSVMANIAEGFETSSDVDFARFLRMALRSCTEVQSHLYVSADVEYITQDVFSEMYGQAKKCSNFIKAFLKYLRKK